MLLIASAMVIWWMIFNGANPLVPALRRYSRISYSGYCCIQTAILPLFSSGYALFEGLFIGGVSAIFEAILVL
jgi:uncharacterized YccA/Bax inhibitor family protein